MDFFKVLRKRLGSRAPAFITHLNVVEGVPKCWGEERLLVPPNTPFAFKVVTVKAGRQTSVHYHRLKEQATLVLSGEGTLYIADSVDALPARFRIGPGYITRVSPGTVHRMTALTDLVVAEVSVPELDDTVSFADDPARPDGWTADKDWG